MEKILNDMSIEALAKWCLENNFELVIQNGVITGVIHNEN